MARISDFLFTIVEVFCTMTKLLNAQEMNDWSIINTVP